MAWTNISADSVLNEDLILVQVTANLTTDRGPGCLLYVQSRRDHAVHGRVRVWGIRVSDLLGVETIKLRKIGGRLVIETPTGVVRTS